MVWSPAWTPVAPSLNSQAHCPNCHEQNLVLKSPLLIQLFSRVFRFLSSNFLPCTRRRCFAGCSLRSKFVVKTKRDQLLHQMVQSVLLLINDVLVVCQCRVQIFPPRHDHVSMRQTCTFKNSSQIVWASFILSFCSVCTCAFSSSPDVSPILHSAHH